MIKLASLVEDKTPKISLQQAKDKKMFGPVYHGTSTDKRDKIDREGFKVFYGHERSGDVSHGYEFQNYYDGIPAPIHHLGYGIYLTTSLSIAKKYSFGTTKGMKIYFLDVPKLETINFGAPRTMMKWWVSNGYDYKKSPRTLFGNPEFDRYTAEIERYRATIHLTEELKSKFDAVWFKGKGIYTLLDGDQVCVYDPSKIYEFDKTLIKPGDIGSRVVLKIGFSPYQGAPMIPMGTKGILLRKREIPPEIRHYHIEAGGPNVHSFYEIKFDKGGTHLNVYNTWVDFIRDFKKL